MVGEGFGFDISYEVGEIVTDDKLFSEEIIFIIFIIFSMDYDEV